MMETLEAVQEKLRPDLCRYVDWIVSHPVPANQIVESAFSRSFSFLRAMTDEHSIGLWLLTLVRREAIDIERGGRQNIGSNELSTPTCSDTEVASLAHAERPGSSAIRMYRAIKRLDTPSREVLVLQSLFGCSLPEIAEITGHAIEDVASRLSKARRSLMVITPEDAATQSHVLSPGVAAYTRHALSDPYVDSA